MQGRVVRVTSRSASQSTKDTIITLDDGTGTLDVDLKQAHKVGVHHCYPSPLTEAVE